MTVITDYDEATGAAAANGSSPKRPRVAVVPGRVLAIALSGLVAVVATASALADKGATVDIAVAAKPIAAGTEVTADLVRGEKIEADSSLARSLLRLSDVGKGNLVALHTLAPGEAISRAAVSPDKVVGLRFVSIPVPRENAAGGEIDPGDLVDVIDYSTSPAKYVLWGAEVVRRAENESRFGSLSGGFHVVVAVTDSQALDIATALKSGKVMLVRSTGAEPPSTAPPPGSGQNAPEGAG